MSEHGFRPLPAAVHVDAGEFVNLPTSARLVFDAVAASCPSTHTELRRVTGLPARTIRFALKRLRDQGFIEARCSLRDCRTCYFFVSQRCRGGEETVLGKGRVNLDRRLEPFEPAAT